MLVTVYQLALLLINHLQKAMNATWHLMLNNCSESAIDRGLHLHAYEVKIIK